MNTPLPGGGGGGPQNVGEKPEVKGNAMVTWCYHHHASFWGFCHMERFIPSSILVSTDRRTFFHTTLAPWHRLMNMTCARGQSEAWFRASPRSAAPGDSGRVRMPLMIQTDRQHSFLTTEIGRTDGVMLTGRKTHRVLMRRVRETLSGRGESPPPAAHGCQDEHVHNISTVQFRWTEHCRD